MTAIHPLSGARQRQGRKGIRIQYEPPPGERGNRFVIWLVRHQLPISLLIWAAVLLVVTAKLS